jgi:GNAT superfamily N-acetyltransferase
MKIERATVGDALEISKLVSKLTESFIAPTCSSPGKELLLESMSEQSIQKYINSGFEYFLIRIDSKIVALIAMKEMSHLYHLFVDESYQGQGLARTLWSFAKNRAVAKYGITKFTVNSSVSSRSVYEKFGFVAIQNERDRNGVVDVPMELLLNAN